MSDNIRNEPQVDSSEEEFIHLVWREAACHYRHKASATTAKITYEEALWRWKQAWSIDTDDI